MEMHRLPGMRAGSPFGPDRDPEYVGLVSEVYPDGPRAARNICEYLSHLPAPGMAFRQVWHGWASYSREYSTVCRKYYAVKWEWQEPSMVQSGEYHVYLLRDVSCLALWRQATCIIILPRLRNVPEVQLDFVCTPCQRIMSECACTPSDSSAANGVFGVPAAPGACLEDLVRQVP